jgi:hypothetical protein
MGGVAAARTPRVGLPKISFSQKLKNFSGNTKTFFSKGKSLWQYTKTSANNIRSGAKLENFKQLSSTKKFFLASALILFIALAVNIGIAAHLKNIRATQNLTASQLAQIQTLLGNAQSSLLYKDSASAAGFLRQAKSLLPKSSAVSAANKDAYNKLAAQEKDIETQMEKVFRPSVTNLGSLGSGNTLIRLPDFLATQANGAVISFQKITGQIQDSNLKLGVSALASVYLSGNQAAVYDGSNLYLWDFSAGKLLGAGFGQNLPGKNDFGGMAPYPVNGRVYVADKKASQIISFLPGKTAFSKPVVAVSDPAIGKSEDITIDSGIYVLTSDGVFRFLAGKQTGFALQNLPTPLSASGKIYTEKSFNYIYILDSGNNRILIFDKSGNLVNTLLSDSFTSLKDFQVDEKNKIIYALNDGSLLKIPLP